MLTHIDLVKEELAIEQFHAILRVVCELNENNDVVSLAFSNFRLQFIPIGSRLAHFINHPLIMNLCIVRKQLCGMTLLIKQAYHFCVFKLMQNQLPVPNQTRQIVYVCGSFSHLLL